VSGAAPVTPLQTSSLALLRGWAAPDPAQEALRREYVGHLEAHPDGLLRSCVPDHLTASTLILSADRAQVLLTLHAKANAWFQVGGHCEPRDTSLAGAARREAVEESGITGLALDPEPVQLSPHDVPFCNPGRSVRHLDVRFWACAPEDAVHQVGEESLDLRWWPADALPTDEPELHELVRLALRRAALSLGG
jgi:8-oxo-dGTP pyrophosphatase MutT (NUDIX family)